jgi:hypothetical protein
VEEFEDVSCGMARSQDDAVSGPGLSILAHYTGDFTLLDEEVVYAGVKVDLPAVIL